MLADVMLCEARFMETGVLADGRVASDMERSEGWIEMLRSMQGTFPTIGSLAVMAAWAVIATVAAVKLFRWE